MKKLVGLGLLLSCIVMFSGCGGDNDKSATKDSAKTESSTEEKKNIDGTYKDSETGMEIVIDGNDVLFTEDGDTSVGTIDNKEKEIAIEEDDDAPYTYSYKIIGNRLVLSSSETEDYILTKGSSGSDSTTNKKSDKKTNEPVQNTDSDDGESYSGKLVVGEDIDAGKYDIKPDGDTDASVQIFENKDAVDSNDYRFEWLFPADEENPGGDILKSYTLREGNILDITGNMTFIKK